MSQILDAKDGTCSSLCVHCSKFLDTSTFVDAISNSDVPGTATVNLVKTISNIAETADECKICKIILNNAHNFEDDTPEIKMEFIFGSKIYDVKLIHLTYQGPTSEDAGFATGFNQVLRRYMVYALPGTSRFRLRSQNLRRLAQVIQQRNLLRPGLSKSPSDLRIASIPPSSGSVNAVQAIGIAPSQEKRSCQIVA